MRRTEPFCPSPTTNDAETPVAAPTAFTAWRPTPVPGTTAESLAVGADMSTHCINDLAAESPPRLARGRKQLGPGVDVEVGFIPLASREQVGGLAG